MRPVLKAKYRTCLRCGGEAEVIAQRTLTEADIPALGVIAGPSCYGTVLLCACGRAWIVLAADTGCWYGIGEELSQ